MGAPRTFQRYIDFSPRLRFQPSLLALIALLSSVPLYPSNARVLMRFANQPSTVDPFCLGMGAASFIFAVALSIYSARKPAWKEPRIRFDRAAGACYVASVMALCILLAIGYENVVLSAALGCLGGICLGPLVLGWIARFAMDFRNVMFHGALVCAGVAILNVILWIVPPVAIPFIIGAAAVCGTVVPLLPNKTRGTSDASDAPAASHASAISGAPAVPEASATSMPSAHADSLGTSVKNFLSMVWIPLIGYLLCLFMMSLYSFAFGGILASESIGGILAAILAMVLCLIPHRSSPVVLIDDLVVPICVAVCIVLGSFPEGTPLLILGASSVQAPLMFLTVFTLASLVAISTAGEFPFPFVFGTMYAICDLVLLIGTVVIFTLGQDYDYASVLWVFLSMYFALVVINLGYTIWRRTCLTRGTRCEDDVASAGADGFGKDIGDKGCDTGDEEFDERQQARFAAIARSYGLTARERELLVYMGRGYSSTYIAKTLFISNSTARTHIRHIYRKLGINSKEELFLLVDGFDMLND